MIFLVYEPLRLLKVVQSKVNQVCKRFLNNEVPEPYLPSLPQSYISVHATKNMRRKMEDRYVIIEDLNTLAGIPVSTYSQNIVFKPDKFACKENSCIRKIL